MIAPSKCDFGHNAKLHKRCVRQALSCTICRTNGGGAQTVNCVTVVAPHRHACRLQRWWSRSSSRRQRRSQSGAPEPCRSRLRSDLACARKDAIGVATRHRIDAASPHCSYTGKMRGAATRSSQSLRAQRVKYFRSRPRARRHVAWVCPECRRACSGSSRNGFLRGFRTFTDWFSFTSVLL